jgi:acetoin utilization protein AcuB
MNVSALMTKSVVVVTQEDTIRTALRLLEECEVRHLPVLAGQNVVGILSDRDVRRYRIPIIEELEHPDFADALLDKSVALAMKADLLIVSENDSLRTAIDVMIECGIGAVPVVAHGTRHLLGMLSYVDVLKALRNGLLDRGIDET